MGEGNRVTQFHRRTVGRTAPLKGRPLLTSRAIASLIRNPGSLAAIMETGLGQAPWALGTSRAMHREFRGGVEAPEAFGRGPPEFRTKWRGWHSPELDARFTIQHLQTHADG
jgi:hypothetical protein